MSYLPYLVSAYAVFVLVLAWDWLSAHRQLRQAQRRARTHRPPPRPRSAPADAGELQR